VFSSSEDLNNSFDTFIAPNLNILAQLDQTPDLRSPAVKIAICGALRDLRGITTSAYSKRTYTLLFEALYPLSFPLFLRIAECWYDDPTVMTALLKFMQVPILLEIFVLLHFQYIGIKLILLHFNTSIFIQFSYIEIFSLLQYNRRSLC